MPDIFLSYSRDDLTTARRFAEAFERGGLTVWWDQTLNPGEAFDEVTEKALNEARAVVVLWSRKSVASRWVRAEATQANDSKKLVPVMIEPCKRPIMFELTHTADLSKWTGGSDDPAWQSYLAGVKRLIGREAGEARSPAATSPPKRDLSHFGMRALVGILVLLVAVSGVYWFVGWSSKVAPKPTEAVAAASLAAAKEVTLAVLPFADMSPAHDQEYFSDGLSEEILNQLAQIRDLRVTARTSSFSFKGKNEDARVIGQKLGVANLLEGSVRKDGAHLRISVTLVNGSDGSHLWSQSYNNELKDVFAVQEAIAKDVANALSVRLGVGFSRELSGGTTNVEAYEKYLRAHALIARGGPDDHQRGLEQYRQALALDPQFARAWSELYEELRYSLIFTPKDQDAVRKEMATASERTLALAPDAWWTHAMRASQLRSQHRWSEAETAAKLAMASAPASEVDAIQAYASFLDDVGRVKESVPYFRRMRDADPLSLKVSGFLQLALRSDGQPAEAQSEYERSKDLAGAHFEWDWYALLRLWQRKDADPAIVARVFHSFAVVDGSPGGALLRQLEDKLNDPAAALAVTRKAFKDPATHDSWGLVTGVALIADHFGDRDLALSAFRRRLELVDFHYIAWWPFETGLRSDPRFKQIVRDLQLDSYWRKSGQWGDFCKPVGKDDFECQ